MDAGCLNTTNGSGLEQPKGDQSNLRRSLIAAACLILLFLTLNLAFLKAGGVRLAL